MELTGKMEEFMNDLIGERMEQVYQEKDGQQYDPFNEKLEMKLQKIFQKLSDKQRTILFDFNDSGTLITRWLVDPRHLTFPIPGFNQYLYGPSINTSISFK